MGHTRRRPHLRRILSAFETRQDRIRQKAYNTRDSQAVSDPSTNRAQRCLTCQIGRDGVLSTWYGRKRRWWVAHGLYTDPGRAPLEYPHMNLPCVAIARWPSSMTHLIQSLHVDNTHTTHAPYGQTHLLLPLEERVFQNLCFVYRFLRVENASEPQTWVIKPTQFGPHQTPSTSAPYPICV